ncbi:MAG: glycosyltransferase, partial [Bacteroidota bacterium]
LRAKKMIFPQLKSPEETFIVFNGNRFDPRKRLDLTMSAFAKFANNKNEHVKLYLHTPMLEQQDGNIVDNLAKVYGIKDRILRLPDSRGKGIVDNKTLNLIYNACDIGINTCEGEGWGLVSCEHAATGAPQIVPAHTSFPEIWESAAVLMPSKGTKPVSYSNHYMFETEEQEIVDALETLYNNQQMRTTLAVAGYRRMNKADFNWATITTQWEGLLCTLVA